MTKEQLENKYGEVKVDKDDLFIDLNPEKWDRIQFKDGVPDIDVKLIKEVLNDVDGMIDYEDYSFRVLANKNKIKIHFFKKTNILRK